GAPVKPAPSPIQSCRNMANARSQKTPAPTGHGEPAKTSRPADIEAFLARARTLAPPVEPGTRGRLVFALDATMSRQPTWDEACRLQADMFAETASIGGLDGQLISYRGMSAV